jgi:uncharacterized coiled-coil DUF342 family protein
MANRIEWLRTALREELETGFGLSKLLKQMDFQHVQMDFQHSQTSYRKNDQLIQTLSGLEWTQERWEQLESALERTHSESRCEIHKLFAR